MIRPLTLVSLLVAAGAGLHLYQVKHSVSLLDRELREVNRQTEVVRERSQVLRAEWALLNEPDRLRQVAQRHLALEPMAPAQFIREAELERRLPNARPFAGPPSLFGPPELPVLVPEALMVPTPVAAVPSAPSPAMAKPEPPPPPRQVQAESPPRLSAAAAAPPAPRPAAPPAQPRVTPALHVAPAAPPPPAVVASALGGFGGALPPPVPLPRPVPVGAPQGATR
jgi:hypothetical protein